MLATIHTRADVARAVVFGVDEVGWATMASQDDTRRHRRSGVCTTLGGAWREMTSQAEFLSPMIVATMELQVKHAAASSAWTDLGVGSEQLRVLSFEACRLALGCGSHASMEEIAAALLMRGVVPEGARSPVRLMAQVAAYVALLGAQAVNPNADHARIEATAHSRFQHHSHAEEAI